MVIVSIPLVTASHRLHIAHWATLPLTTSSTDDSAEKIENKIVPMFGGRQNICRFCHGAHILLIRKQTYCLGKMQTRHKAESSVACLQPADSDHRGTMTVRTAPSPPSSLLMSQYSGRQPDNRTLPVTRRRWPHCCNLQSDTRPVSEEYHHDHLSDQVSACYHHLHNLFDYL